jgi:hypothetical protein
MKRVFAGVIATAIVITLAACSGSSTTGAKEINLHFNNSKLTTVKVNKRVDFSADLAVGTSKLKSYDVVVEESISGGAWTQIKKIVAHKGVSMIGFATLPTTAGDYKFRATLSGTGYGPFTSAELPLKVTK